MKMDTKLIFYQERWFGSLFPSLHNLMFKISLDSVDLVVGREKRDHNRDQYS